MTFHTYRAKLGQDGENLIFQDPENELNRIDSHLRTS